MKKLAVLVLLFMLLSGTACSANLESESTSTPRSTPSTVGEVAEAAGMGIPKPKAEQESKLKADIEAINPAFINRKTVDNARNQCRSVLGGSTEESLTEGVKARFEGLGVESVSDTEAAQLLNVIRTNGFCK